MIEFTRSSSQSAPTLKLIGLGGAGGNVLDRLVLDGFDAACAVAMNTDVQKLNGSVAGEKVHLGQKTTRGLGTGGDPEVGYAAAEESAEEITTALAGAQLVFICVGLGGGTGSGAAPLIAHLAGKAGAMVIAFVTLPFSFEGKRRQAQALDALAQIEAQANLVVCFENDRMGEASSPSAGIQQAFVASDAVLSQSIRSIAGLVEQRGWVSVGIDDLAAVLRRQQARALFGYGESDGPNRAHEALERALRCPLMDKGRMLADAHTVLVHVAGGTELTLNEVSVLMEEFNRHISDGTRINFGVSTDARYGRKLCVSILSSTGDAVVASQAKPTVPKFVAVEKKEDLFEKKETAPIFEADQELEPFEELEEPEPVKPAAKVAPQPILKQAAAPKKEEKAEQMSLEPVNRGRFDKGEPTIVDGEDLDVPTFLRKNLKVK